jgi:hypothetical protein
MTSERTNQFRTKPAAVRIEVLSTKAASDSNDLLWRGPAVDDFPMPPLGMLSADALPDARITDLFVSRSFEPVSSLTCLAVEKSCRAFFTDLECVPRRLSSPALPDNQVASEPNTLSA